MVVELRGLHSSPDTSAVDADLGLPSGHRDSCLVDFRPAAEGQLVDPELALEKLSVVKRMVEAACGGRAREDITVALGGLAAVPCMFLAGMMFDDESNVVVFDWDRSKRLGV
ncbi:SAVED domain-containing protein (plasmid) [Cupriavidus basilensis]